eukprot:PLAT6246.1.p1 GENE.PLAT6246.1~~PLAT6246.1.p1  ORF type:complete len:188 (-),score=93.82 PLAT6246.1:192-755(-)
MADDSAAAPTGKGVIGRASLHHAMIRVKDPKASLRFYRDLLGMSLLRSKDYGSFTLYFLAYLPDGTVLPEDEDELHEWVLSFPGTCVELTHNHGTEDDEDFAYHNGNSEPRGFGHLCVLVDDVYAACDALEAEGVEFQKKPDDGRMKGLAFAKDPDGYWIEIIRRRRWGEKKEEAAAEAAAADAAEE